MRIYVPATLAMLHQVEADKEVGPAPLTAFAVTPALREWYLDDDEEVLEYAAFSQAARAALRLLDNDPSAPRRRVVLSADVPDRDVTLHPDLERAVVRSSVPISLDRLASIHVDGAEAEADVAAAARVIMEADLGDEDAQFVVDGTDDYELEWYGVQELPELLESFSV
ncbi:DUF6912 family protein [Cryptosporangium phraense]|uniref:Uncharacterized protein n=1 Tax=Cryptosporangium phraense TaxID=2593070 RepID=A0A545ANG9_9ACTN|nr:hypothetical protein [Cryptosporangium phraense]TQS42888.1 hypothetical protein FL583_22865 [Cryptosporangium phraense]